MRSVGVEEELLLMDAHHDRTSPAATRVLRIATARADVDRGDDGRDPDGDLDRDIDPETGGDVIRGSLTHELQEDQLETNTPPRVAMSELEEDLRIWRNKAVTAARQAGSRVVASATSPVAAEPRQVHTPRYDELAQRYGIITREQLTCGCHVHVSVSSDDEAVGVLDRIRVWLPGLLALSANSPFWQGCDSGYASYRWLAMGRWPVAGPTELFGNAQGYREHIERLLTTGVVLDEGMLYYDARCAVRYPTVEIRVADVCLDVRDTVLVAALCRGLVETAAEEWAAAVPAPPIPTPVLRLASWQAARWGISDTLLDPLTSRPRPAAEVVAALVEHVRPALRRSGDEQLVIEGIDRVFTRGNGATRQRAVLEKTGRLNDVVAALARATVGHDG